MHRSAIDDKSRVGGGRAVAEVNKTTRVTAGGRAVGREAALCCGGKLGEAYFAPNCSGRAATGGHGMVGTAVSPKKHKPASDGGKYGIASRCAVIKACLSMVTECDCSICRRRGIKKTHLGRENSNTINNKTGTSCGG